MKIFKKILTVIAILLLVISAIGLLFFSSHISVERSIIINRDRSTVYNYTQDLKNFQQWSPWFELDTAAQYTYAATTAGKGGSMSWKSKVDNVGNGSMTITDVIQDSLVAIDLNFMENGVAKGTYIFTPEGNNTKMTWGFAFEAGKNPLMRIIGKFMDGMIGPDFERGLAKLKTRLESMPVTSSNISVEEVEVPETDYMFYHGKANLSNISQFLGSSYQKIGAAMKKQKLEMASAPFAIYYTDSQSAWELDAACAVKPSGKDDGDVKAGKMKAGKAVRARFFGAYEQTPLGHKAAYEYITKNNKKITGPTWEVYITDPMVEKDTAKWETDIYYPIQ